MQVASRFDVTLTREDAVPSGYTCGVQDGSVTEFRAFALLCARAFGATIMQRDDPMHEPPKLQEVDAYYVEAVERAREGVRRVTCQTEEEARAEKATADASELARYEDSVRKIEVEKIRYLAMLEQARAWKPPTEEHEGLKDFMVKQLTESMQFDCGYIPTRPVPHSFEVWRKEQAVAAHKSLKYAIESLEQQQALVAGRNAWITELYGSLGGAHASL